MKKVILLFLTILFLTPSIIFASEPLSEEFEYDLYRGKVISVDNNIEVSDGVRSESQKAEVEIINRDKKGEIVTVYNFLSGDSPYDMKLSEGTIVNINYDGENYHFISYDNVRPIVLLSIVFIAILLLIGGVKGIKALAALLITITIITTFMIPSLLKGANPIIVSVITCALATLVTFLIISGFNKKTLIATLGTTTGLVSGGIIAYIFGLFARLSGFSSSDATMLMYLPSGVELDFRGLLFAGIIIGALGASMDVSISIASSLSEIKNQNPNIKMNELVKSGFNIGKDIMGTMVNTLVLAYVGGSLATLLVFVGFSTSFYHVINLDFVATEFVRAIAGSVGLLIAIPATIMFFITFNYNKEENYEKIS